MPFTASSRLRIERALPLEHPGSSSERGSAGCTVDVPALQRTNGVAERRNLAGSRLRERAFQLKDGFSFGKVAFDDAEATTDVYASFSVDRGGYTASEGRITSHGYLVGCKFRRRRSHAGTVSAFADVSNRLSTGIADAGAFFEPRIGGTRKTFDAGVDAAGSGYDVTGVGFFGVGYTGSFDGIDVPSDARMTHAVAANPTLPRFEVERRSRRKRVVYLPTLWQQYAPNGGYSGLVYDRNSLYSAMLSYSDNARVRVCAEAASQNVTGYTNGRGCITGASLAWQVAPAIALRGRGRYVSDDTSAPALAAPFYPRDRRPMLTRSG